MEWICFGFLRSNSGRSGKEDGGAACRDEDLFKCIPAKMKEIRPVMLHGHKSPDILKRGADQIQCQSCSYKSCKGDALSGSRRDLEARSSMDFVLNHTPARSYRAWIQSHKDFEGNKMINGYVRECKIGSGSHCKVVLHRNNRNGNLYAIKIFRKSRLLKIRVSHSGTAMTKILTEVAIMKQLDHPNIVKLIEVIDDPESDRLYMVLEYMEGGSIFEGSGPSHGIGEGIARKYYQNIVAGLQYLHNNNIVHGDIKPENLLVSRDGCVKICDFSESCKFEDNNDEIQRPYGTPVFMAPECSQGLVYHGKEADVWALGITLYCMVFGQFPFFGETLRETFDKIVNHPLVLPDNFNSDLADLLNCLLCKDPCRRISLDEAMKHPWVVRHKDIPSL